MCTIAHRPVGGGSQTSCVATRAGDETFHSSSGQCLPAREEQSPCPIIFWSTSNVIASLLSISWHAMSLGGPPFVNGTPGVDLSNWEAPPAHLHMCWTESPWLDALGHSTHVFQFFKPWNRDVFEEGGSIVHAARSWGRGTRTAVRRVVRGKTGDRGSAHSPLATP